MSPKSYEQSDLLEAVQQARIFPDGKTFVDCRPRSPLPDLLKTYNSEKNNPAFSLTDFIHIHFEIPENPDPGFEANRNEPLHLHIQKLWPVLTRRPAAANGGSLISLPHPYVVPGGRFREIYYWDSYFTMLGLAANGQMSMVENMVMNFAHLIDMVGYVPNGNRTYYLGRSQPPFFSLMVQLLANHSKPGQLARFLPQLKREYEYWMRGQEEISNLNEARFQVVLTTSGETLNRYWDEEDRPRPESFLEDQKLAKKTSDCQIYRHLRAGAASGWDFSSRWFGDGKSMASIQALDIIPVDLTALLYGMETSLAQLYQHQQQAERAAFYTARAEKRRQLLQQYHYDAATGAYQDMNFRTGKPTGQLSLAMVYPLYFGAASVESAATIAQTLEQQFLKPGGLVTSLSFSGEQWDAPNGWAPLQYLAVEGLLRYGHKDLALDVARRWLALNERVYREEGKMMEKYNVVDVQLKAGGGNYPNQDGFGWTNGVALAFYHLLEQEAAN